MSPALHTQHTCCLGPCVIDVERLLLGSIVERGAIGIGAPWTELELAKYLSTPCARLNSLIYLDCDRSSLFASPGCSQASGRLI